MKRNLTIPAGFIAVCALAAVAGGCASYDAPVVTDGATVNIDVTGRPWFVGQSGSVPYDGPVPALDDYRLWVTDQATDRTVSFGNLTKAVTISGIDAGTYKLQVSSAPTEDYPGMGCDTTMTLAAGSMNNVHLTAIPLAARVSNSTTSGQELTIGASYVMSPTLGEKLLPAAGDTLLPPDITRPGVEIHRVSDGRTVRVVLPRAVNLAAGNAYDWTYAIAGDKLVFTDDWSGSQQMTLTDAAFDMARPKVNVSGADDGGTVTVTEGSKPGESLVFEATSGARLSHFYILFDSNGASLDNFPSILTIDVLDMTDEVSRLFPAGILPVEINNDTTAVRVNMDRIIEGLSSLVTANVSFSAYACDVLSRASDQAMVNVESRSVGFNIVEVQPAVLGTDIATVVLEPTLPGIDISDISIRDKQDQKFAITAIRSCNGGNVEVDVKVPRGLGALDCSVYYMDIMRCGVVIDRVLPDFDIVLDAYALSLDVQVTCDDEAGRRALTGVLEFAINEKEAHVLERNPAKGTVTLNQLQPDNKYTLTVSAPGYTRLRYRNFTTEKALQLPDPDFEDAVTLFEYKNLPSGGRYAMWSLDMVNRQNYRTVSVSWPHTAWASVNARTFCMSARNHNTWYMQPSSYIVHDSQSGSKAICVQSVGWDTNGEAIPDFIPTALQAPAQWSGNVPDVAYRSAGRLFLGSYRFDPTTLEENFAEGYPFKSRPKALNGFYKFAADQTNPGDRGGVTIELVSRTPQGEITVARGSKTFAPAGDYTAFNVPLTYTAKVLTPTHLKIMFVSSTQADDEAIVDLKVPVTPYPAQAAMTGSTLWVDNLSLTY